MEKRYILFIVLSMALMLSYQGLSLWLNPPDPDAVSTADENGEAASEDGQGGGEDGSSDQPENDDPPDGAQAEADSEGAGPGEEGAAGADSPNDGTADNPPVVESTNDGAFTALGPQNPPEWVTLGAYDGSLGPHAVTVSSLGGGIVRWELVERNARGRLRYRDLRTKGGYLGVSAWTRSPDGCEVQAIIPGSPAEEVFQLGDEVRQVAGRTVTSIEGLEQLIAEYESRDTVEFTYARNQMVASASIQLAPRPLQLVRPEHTQAGALANNPASFRVGLVSVDGQMVDPEQLSLEPLRRLETDHWKVTRATDREVELHYELPGAAITLLDQVDESDGIEIVKRFRLVPAGEDAAANPGYVVEFDIEVNSLGDSSHALVLEVEGPNGVTREGWWFQNKMHPKMFKSAGARDVVLRAPELGRVFRGTGEIYSTAKKRPKSPVEPFVSPADPEAMRTLRFLAVDTQYFAVALMGEQPAEDFVVRGAEPRMVGEVEDVERSRIKTVNTTFAIRTQTFTVGEEGAGFQYTIFGGPKRSSLLETYELGPLLEYGWFWWVAKPLASVLHALHAVVRNYGLAIILLTVLVRGMMLPLGRKAAKNAMMMQQLAPEMSKIKEKYKGDMQKQGEAQRELYAKYNFNPLSGCLPMFIQLPIFLGLYRCLSVDINLRQAPLIPGVDWCGNLAAPDQLWHWSSVLPDMLASETGWLGPYLNILPIITIILFLTQQKLFSPPPQDEQQAMQQKIMMYMMVFIGVMFFKVPAGLCIYFITSSIWGIMERQLLPKPELKEQKQGGGGGGGKEGPAGERGMEPSKASLVKRERARQRRRDRKN